MTVVPPHALPVSKRSKRPWSRTPYAILFFILFNLGCLMVNGTQFIVVLPLRLLPFEWARSLYTKGINYTKGAFGCLLVLICSIFSPTTLRVSFETEGNGRFTQAEVDSIAKYNDAGQVVGLNLPNKVVVISNHQVYLDWLFEWCLLYFIEPGVHKHVYITLKASLKWIPVVGWGMQFFDFIFLSRSWASDRLKLSKSLSRLGVSAASKDIPFAYLLYPEGTLVSKDTRPLSRKFADKMGINDLTHLLLPRSTGLHYSLRSLATRVPDLQLLDLTVVYEGIPPLAYGQDYYTLRSVFFDGIAPPAIHIHIRKFDVSRDIPIGNLSAAQPSGLPKASDSNTVELDIPENEKTIFDTWLRALWTDKDASIEKFYGPTSFEGPSVDIPIKLRRRREYLDAFCFFVPAAIGYLTERS
ncbi:hypothetical protein CYLTODRAFT_424273 [Cylindrobasidium torrendii FP15055 ss-10]|uniref:Phospholipid/glycerol acyltransferase domain-containing protein n=1 Tax=Cylindrobasidium torrendii FP15055 ss-10 TaxID=1314674 RepID=A0A0D7B4S7_9AGAR|nr:hypothetical protein CYLTODRAFT_424273 [Cylindrobasidium torrendii FP15055 ss-10]